MVNFQTKKTVIWGNLSTSLGLNTKQTSKHILQECEVFAHLRFLIFHDAFPQSMEKITDFMLTRFIKESNFKWFPYDDDPLEDPG